MPVLIVATGNPGKLKEMQAYLTELDCELRLKPNELEIEETGQTFLENACLKASQVATTLGAWAIADDSGLAVDALGGAPGVYSARYGTSDANRIQRLLHELEGQPNRKARFICVVAVAHPNGTIALHTEGVCPGEILHAPRGTGGFGYDPIFFVPEQQMTFAEMPSEVKHTVSHRGRAFQQLISKLPEILH